MPKRPNLADRVKARATADTSKSQNDPAEPATRVPPSRAGKSFIGGYFAPEVNKQLGILAIEQETTREALIGEALNHLFAAYGKPEIAESKNGKKKT